MNPAEEGVIHGPWRVHGVTDAVSTVRLGPLSLFMTERAGEIRIAHHRDPEADPDAAPPEDAGPAPADLEWGRWAVRERTGRLALTPAFPDRPVVVDPQDDFHLMAGAEARIYVRVPLWVRIEAVGPDDRRTPLLSLPSVVGSDTWWGTVAEGELAYWLSTRARRAIRPDHFLDHLVVCPMHLVNRSDGTLSVSQIAVRVEHLSLYTDSRGLWADETRVRYEGESVGSRLDMTGRPPAEARDARLIAAARQPMARGFHARTFSRLRSSLQSWM